MSIEKVPTISMRPRDHYVTQSGMFDVQRLGRLTDRRIAKYQREGRYGNGFVQELNETKKKEKKPKLEKKPSLRALAKQSLKDLFKDLL